MRHPRPWPRPPLNGPSCSKKGRGKKQKNIYGLFFGVRISKPKDSQQRFVETWDIQGSLESGDAAMSPLTTTPLLLSCARILAILLNSGWLNYFHNPLDLGKNPQFAKVFFLIWDGSTTKNCCSWREWPKIAIQRFCQPWVPNPYGSSRTFLGSVWGIIYYNLEG